MQGWIKVHRELFDADIWHDVSTFRLFIYLIAQASHKDGVKIKGIELKRGQFVRSYRKLADDLSYKEGRGFKKYSLSTIKNCVKKLIDAERVNVKETEAGTLFTIVNYAKYQDFEGAEKKSPNTVNREVRTNTELTPNEVRTNCEQEQELKNLSIKELKEVVIEDSRKDLSAVFRFYEQNGFGVIGSHISEKIIVWCEDLSEELVLEALKQSVENGKKFWGYTEAILKSWADKNIKTVDEAVAARLEYKAQLRKKSYSRKKRPTRTEKLPDWFNEQEKIVSENDMSHEELEEKRKRVLEIQQKYRKGG